MSFQAYIDNVAAKTGHTPDDFRRLAEAKGLLRAGVKAGEITGWLQKDFGLGLAMRGRSTPRSNRICRARAS